MFRGADDPTVTYSRRACRRCGLEMRLEATGARSEWRCPQCGRTEH